MKVILGKVKINWESIRKNLTLIGIFGLLIVSLFFHFHENYHLKKSIAISQQYKVAVNDLKVTFNYIQWAAKQDTSGYLKEEARKIGIKFPGDDTLNTIKRPQLKKN